MDKTLYYGDSWTVFLSLWPTKVCTGLLIPIFNGFKAPCFIAGAGLRQERLSTQAGFCCPDKTNWFVKTT
jgi:hypothetical protein